MGFAHWISGGWVDLRLAQYGLIFFIGIIAGRVGSAERHLTGWPAVICSCLALPALWWGSLHTTGYLAVLVAQAAIMAFLPPAFLVATIASRWLNPVLIRQIAYASFAMYLLHRLTVGLPSTLYAPTAAWPSLVYLYGLWLPLTFVSAWVVQRIYDYCYKAVTAPSR